MAHNILVLYFVHLLILPLFHLLKEVDVLVPSFYEHHVITKSALLTNQPASSTTECYPYYFLAYIKFITMINPQIFDD